MLDSKIELRMTALLQNIKKYHETIDFYRVADGNSEFDKNLLKIFESLCIHVKNADTGVELQQSLKNQPLFFVTLEIDELVNEWSSLLAGDLKSPDALQTVNDYLGRYNKHVFDMYASNATIDEVITLWGASYVLADGARKFLTLLLLYALTKAFAVDEEKFEDRLRSVEAFFYIRDYLINDADFPVKFAQGDLVGEPLKSIMSYQEILLAEKIKSLTAAGAVSQALQREDLEGKNRKKKKSKAENTDKKSYNRIEKLEDD